MSSHRRACAALFSVVIVGIGAAGHTVSARAAGTRVLTTNVIRNIGSLHSTGLLDPATVLNLGIALARPNRAGEAAFQADVYNPLSPNYRHFLSTDAFNARFGVTAVTFQSTVAWLSGGGLTTVAVPGSTEYLLAQGTVAQVSALLSTEFRTYDGGLMANATAPTVPADLPILGILGLTNREHKQTALEMSQRAAARSASAAAAPVPNAAVPNTGSLTPADLWSIYDQPSSNYGEGQSIALFLWGRSDQSEANLRTFEAHNHLAQVPFTQHYYGTDALDTSSVDQEESDIDTQASSGMAPNIQHLTMYMGQQGSDTDLVAAFNAWVNDPNGAKQGSASYGGCEDAGTVSTIPNPAASTASAGDGVFQPATDAALSRGVSEGRTLFVSTGDTGSSCPLVGPATVNGVTNEIVPLLNYPAASQYAVAVGGTVLYSDGNTPAHRFSETAWTHTGGGTDLFIPAPSWQQGVTAITTRCIQGPEGQTYTPPPPLCRGTPDVAAISGDVASNGYTIVDSLTSRGGGTSLSSPLWCGMWTRINAAAAAASDGSFPGLGFASPSLYQVGKDPTAGPRDYFDIVVGSNGLYTALPSWDYVSGWGSPDVRNLMLDLAGGLAPSNPVPPPVPGTSQTYNLDPCSPTFVSDPSIDDGTFAFEGQSLGAPGSNPQLDVTSGALKLSADGKTLRTIITVRALSYTITPPGGENDYRVLWDYAGTKYFSLVTVLPGNQVQFWDGQAFVLPVTTKYQPVNLDQGVFDTTTSTIEVDVPLANVGMPPPGAVLSGITAEADVRFPGTATAGLLQTIDVDGPNLDFLIGQTCLTANVPEVGGAATLVPAGLTGFAVAGGLRRLRRGRRRGAARD